MSFFKTYINRLFAKFGLRVSALKNRWVRPENFSNLVAGYQYQINQSNGVVCPPGNSMRTRLLGRLLGTSPTQAFEIIRALHATENIPGDICEFGVAQGETSALMANEIISNDKTLHLFDSFAGLPKPTEKDHLKDDIFSLGSMEAYEGEMSCAVDMVTSRLAMIEFPKNRYRIHKGFIEDLISEKKGFPRTVTFAYVDFDFYEPIKIALEYLVTVLCKGGMIMVDDYDYFSTGAKSAVDEFIADKNSVQEHYGLKVADRQLGCFAIITKL